jgi:hypothetical protein
MLGLCEGGADGGGEADREMGSKWEMGFGRFCVKTRVVSEVIIKSYELRLGRFPILIAFESKSLWSGCAMGNILLFMPNSQSPEKWPLSASLLPHG